MRAAIAKKTYSGVLSISAHSLDVACCFVALLDNRVMRRRAETLLGHELSRQLIDRLAVLAFLHDAGKLSSSFQERIRGYGEGTGHLLPFMQVLDQKLPSIADALSLPHMCDWGTSIDGAGSSAMLLLYGGQAHHGRPPDVMESGDWGDRSYFSPIAAARLFGQDMRRLFPRAFKPGPGFSVTPEFQHFYIGLLTLADQIGSKSESFIMGRERLDKPATMRLARRIVRRVGLGNGTPSADLPDWAATFNWPAGSDLKPMQRAMLEIPEHVRLAILESETGSGKTEASIVRFIELWRRGEVDGLYFAVPTRTAAVQLHQRIDHALKTISGIETVLAIPGVPRVGAAAGEPLPGYEVRWDDNPRESKKTERWAAETSRRYLAARIAVGTIDQAMSAALQRKWAHMRGASLSRSLLVIDEVHASDPYMKTIIRQLLLDHRKSGGHALLMSATLGSHARATLLGTKIKERERQADYPAISWCGPEGEERFLFPPKDLREKEVAVSTVSDMEDPVAIAARLVEHYEAGARVLLIRNTIASAIAVFDEVRRQAPGARMLSVNGIPTLHHSRFAAEDRQRLDQAVEAMLGKGSDPDPCIVIGSQTLEQSLDIDADILITDICPIDVLLQRVGRLHRHQRADRPAAFVRPRAVVLRPADLSPAHNFSRYGVGPMGRNDPDGVYPDLVSLNAVCEMIAEMPVWHIPQMNRKLVERGTDPEDLMRDARRMGSLWSNHFQKQQAHARSKSVVAGFGILERSKFILDITSLFPMENPATTRLGEMGLELELPEGHPGSFGLSAKTLAIPHKFCPDWDGLDFRTIDINQIALGQFVFTLDHRGLQRADLAQ